MARDALERTVNVKVKRTWRKMSVRKAAYLRLGEKAVAGDAKAFDYLLSLESQEHQPGPDQAEADRSAAKDLARSFKIFSIVVASAYRNSMMISSINLARGKGRTNEIAQTCVPVAYRANNPSCLG
jgi:hypothetical protein